MMSMVTVTESAKEELRRVLETNSLEPGKYLRLATPPVWEGEGDFGIVIDDMGTHDHVVDFEGVQVLLVDRALDDHLSDAVFDFKESPSGPRFTLDVY